jgi:diaminopimelate decarboxylase
VGELHVAAAGGVARDQTLVHGVNKNAADLDAAVIQAGVIVVDNLPELERLAQRHSLGKYAAGAGRFPDLWLRIRPGLAVDTHAYRQTGQSDSKFGLEPDEAVEAVAVCKAQGLPLTGLHFHQGSHFHDPTPIGPALEMVLDLAAALHARHGWSPQALCPGGGWGVPYHEDDLPHPPVESYVAFVAQRLAEGCRLRRLPLPRLQLEPGRSLAAQAGVAIYRVGALKQSAQRRWVLIDGGMADNPRPALYGARYSALPVCAPERPNRSPVWLAGPYCESGDVLIEQLPLPDLAEGELLAIPTSGAYHLPMGSNYNGALKPAVLWLTQNRGGQGHAHLIQRRESLDDLIRRDLPLPDEC